MINVIPVPAFNDNYLWLFHRVGSRRAFVVDPGDAGPVTAALKDNGLELDAILVTHHHADHTGGISELLKIATVPVYGPFSAKIPQVTHPLAEGDRICLDSEIHFEVLEVPGHTLDHIAYYDRRNRILYCGDTLFAAGCGRMFEGEPRQMLNSLHKLSTLPADTAVYCAHEYTQANLAFAATVEPDNPEIRERAQQTRRLRASNTPTVPSSIDSELRTNPFLRVTEPSVIAAANRYTGRQLTQPSSVFAALRAWKDNY